MPTIAVRTAVSAGDLDTVVAQPGDVSAREGSGGGAGEAATVAAGRAAAVLAPDPGADGCADDEVHPAQTISAATQHIAAARAPVPAGRMPSS
ncbi:hypothetical protein [Trebonia sp.]|uniref:hypothetical protein n=1 Tax=Trebonia sp. TaxID=2767075 RepID=UPI002602A83A|nr:hypothetical protein [Trebonia sp.]